MEFKHQPVLMEEVLENLPARSCFARQHAFGKAGGGLATSDAGGPKKVGVFVDGTLGGGGHTKAILEKYPAKVVGIDKDLESIFAAKKNLSDFGDRVEFVHDNFSNLPVILKSKGVDKVDAILLDLGVSSYQLDNAERGFSFRGDAPLDMRMNKEDEKTAADVINSYDEETLADIFYNFGEERNSRRIASEIIKRRPIQTTGELSQIVEQSFPASYRRKYKIHPATRVFQALRIEVNDELKILEDFIPKAADLLTGDGRLLIISFHSLEDRIAKQTFKKLEAENKDLFKIITEKPIIAGDEEIKNNPRSRSAKLRVLEKLN